MKSAVLKQAAIGVCAVAVVVGVSGTALAGPVIGGDPIHTEDDYLSANGWGLNVYSYVFDETSASLPGSFALDPGQMLFIYVIDGDDTMTVSIDNFSVGNPNNFPVNSVGWDSTVVPAGYDPADFQDPHLYGYSSPALATVYTFANNPFDPFSTLEPDEYSLVYYKALSPAWLPVPGTASGGGLGDNTIVPGPGIPEPTTISLLALAALAALRRR